MRVGLRRLGRVLAAAALATGASLVVLGGTAGAAEFTVTNTADDGSNTSLRDVIENQATNDGDVVILTAGATYTLSTTICSDLDTAADITIRSSSTTQNATIIQNCNNSDVNVIDAGDEDLSLTVQNVNITGGSSSEDGGAINVDADLTLIRSRVFGNTTGDDGGALDVPGDALIISSTIDGNCAEDDAGALQLGGDYAVLINSTVTNNTSSENAAIEAGQGGVNLVYSDVVANIHENEVDCGAPNDESLSADDAEDGDEVPVPDPDDLEVGPVATNQPANILVGVNGLDAFGSVVALPIDNDDPPDEFNCEFQDGGTTDSHGYNFSDDDSCGFTGTGDRENAGDPGLGTLADNGGPTPTLLPAATSPLVNFIPLAACSGGDALAEQAITEDQRGIARPQDVGCEIGSVELEALVVAFTG